MDYTEKIDLHMHTVFSDGTDTPEEIIARVRESGIGLFSVTDHDGIKAASAIPPLLSENGPAFITGVEFSCRDGEGKYHVLGYGYDPDAFAFGIPGIDRILFNDPATIVFWEDGTKTVVKCMAGEKFERYAGFAAAVMKKMFGSTSAAKSFMNGMDDTTPVKREPEKTPPPEKPRQDVKDQKLSEHDLTMMAVLGLAAAKVLAKKAKEDQDESSAG